MGFNRRVEILDTSKMCIRDRYNEMLLSKVTGTNNSVVQDRYITITVAKRNIDEARTYFSRVRCV